MKSLLHTHRKLASETSWSLVDQVVTIVGSTITFFLLGRTLGAAGYGAYISLYGLLGPFISFGHAGVALSIIEHLVREREDSVKVARSGAAIALWFATFTTPVILLAGHAILNGKMTATQLTLLVVADYVLMALILANAALVQGAVGFNPAAQMRIAIKVVRLVAVLALHLAGRLTLTNLAIAQTLTMAGQLLVADRKTAALVGHHARPGRVVGAHVRSMFVYSVGISASALQTDADKPILIASNHASDAGRYGAAYRLVLMGLAPVSALIGATHMDFLDANSDPNNQMRKALRLASVSAVYALVIGVGMWLSAPLVPRILGSDFDGTASMIRWLAPVVLLRGSGTFPMNGLLGLGRNGLRTKILVANAVLSLAIYFALIPKYSWRGAIAGTLISEVTLFTSGWIALGWCQRTHRPERLLEAALS